MKCRILSDLLLAVAMLSCVSVHAVEDAISHNPEAVKASTAAEAKLGIPAILEHIITQTYQPRYAELAASTKQLLQLSSQLCIEPSVDLLTVVRDQFAQSVFKFSGIEFYRLGPLLQSNRQNRLFYWPDKRRVGERQLRGLLALPEVLTLDSSAIAKKSVALQGFPALERLLYAKEAETRLGASSEFPDCHITKAIAGNMHTMVVSMVEGWSDESIIVQAMRGPLAESKDFRTEEEVLRSIVTQISVGIEALLFRKVGLFLDADQRALRKAPFWKSGQTLASLLANLESIQALLLDSGLAEYAELKNELNFEFGTATGLLHKLQALPSLTEESGELTAVAQSLFKSLAAVLGGIQTTVNDRFMAALGITAGFNSDDGD